MNCNVNVQWLYINSVHMQTNTEAQTVSRRYDVIHCIMVKQPQSYEAALIVNISCAANQHIRIISEGTLKTGIMMLKIQNKLHFKIYSNRKQLFVIVIFHSITDFSVCVCVCAYLKITRDQISFQSKLKTYLLTLMSFQTRMLIFFHEAWKRNFFTFFQKVISKFSKRQK